MPPCDTPQPDLNLAVNVGPAVDLESWRLTVPAKPGCYLLTDEAGTPVLLGTAANLRNVLVHRLTAPPDEEGPTKRIDYRQVVRQIHYRPAFSRFEADWTYIANVRRVYPKPAAKLTRKWRGHWIHIDLTDQHPRFTAAHAPTGSADQFFGPLPTANIARLVVETLEDLFDLCRYHDILKQSPHGQACAYKEMGKCPAPCDGTVSMAHYANQLRDARQLLTDGPPQWIEQARHRMTDASKAMAFEEAGRIKTQIDEAAKLTGEKFNAFAPMTEHRYLLIAPGSRKHHARPFIVRPDGVTFLGEIIKRDRPAQIDWLCNQTAPLLDQPIGQPLAAVGLMSWYLLRAEKERGIWLSGQDARDSQKIAAAIDELWSTEAPEPDDTEDASSNADDDQDYITSG